MNKTLLSLFKGKLFLIFFVLISSVSFSQTTLFQFDFESNTGTAIPNIDNIIGSPAFGLSGVASPSYTNASPCQGTYMVTGSNWNTGDYYRFTANTTGFGAMTFSFCNRTSNIDIGTFLVKVSSDGGVNWDTVLGAFTPTTVNNTLTTVTFPITSDNAAEVLIEITKLDKANKVDRTFIIDNATLKGYPIPTITSFNPTTVCPGESINIAGTNFAGATGVSINNLAVASYTVNSSTSITAILLSGNTSGIVKVSNVYGKGASGSSLVVNAVPTITVSPTVASLCANTVQVLSATTAASVTAIIGTGTLTNTANADTATDYPAPYGAWYENVKQQYLILASELTSSGLGNGSVINSLTFDVTTLGTSGIHTAYTISMGNTPQSSITTWENGLTTVFGPTNYQPVNGANTHNFTTSFVWDGISNIVIQICHTNDDKNSGNKYTVNAQSKYSTTTFNSSLTYRVDNTDGCGSSTISYTEAQRPNMRFTTAAPTVAWSPITNLFTDALATTPYLGNNLATVYAKPTATIIYSAKVTSANACSNSVTSNLTVTGIPTAPIVILKKQPDCITSTGSVQLTGLPATGSWTIIPNPATAGLTGLTGSGIDNTIVGGLTANTSYTFTVSSGACPSGTSTSTMINPVVTTTYNGTSWSSVPDLTKIGIYTTSGNLSANVDLCSCTVSTGVNIKVLTGVVVKIQDKLSVNGSLTFEDGSSLVQINDAAVNTGIITYKRTTTTQIDNFDYTYWSSPVSAQKLIDVSPNTSLDKFYSFNLAANDWYQENPNNNMINGIGYIIRGPQTYVAPAPPNFYQAPFKGIPNNGAVTVTIPPTAAALEASALLGNPYPSALNADLFLISNMTTALEGTLYFWTHNTNIGAGLANLGSGAYAYTSDDYATYNLTGGAATGIGTPAAGINNSVPNGKIASGQAFFAGIKPAGGIVAYNNSMRLSTAGVILDNSQFFKLNNSKAEVNSFLEKDRVWLNLYNSQGAFKQTLVGYITGATNEYDNGYDGETFDGNEFVDFYSVNQDKNLVIQGRALPFDVDDEVPIGYKTTIAGDFTIAIAQTDGLLVGKDVFLEDKITKSVKNLKGAVYNFNTGAGTFNDRFVLKYSNKTLANESFETLNNTVLVSVRNKIFKINSYSEKIENVQVYDLLGKSIYKNGKVDANEVTISTIISNQQVLLIKIKLINGQIVTRKVIY